MTAPVGSAPAPGGNRNLLLIIGAIVGLCVCGACVATLGTVFVLPNILTTPTPTLEVFPVSSPTPPLNIGRGTSTPAATVRATSTTAGTVRAPSPTPPGIILRGTPTRASSGTTVVFTDNFSGTCNLPEGDNEKRTFACENGQYTILNKNNSSRWVYYTDEWKDIVIEADGHAISGPDFIEYGVIFRVSDDGKSFYGFTITRDGRFTLFKYQDPDFTDLITYTNDASVKKGTANNHFKAVAQGNQLAIYLNEQWLNTFSDSSFGNGSVGFFINNKEANAKVAFSNLVVSEINSRLSLPTGKPVPTPTRKP